MGLDPDTSATISTKSWDEQCRDDPLLNPPLKQKRKPGVEDDIEKTEQTLANVSNFDIIFPGQHTNVIEESKQDSIESGRNIEVTG